MLKNISELSNKSFEYQKEFLNECTIEEKVDTHYVSIEVASKSKLIFRKANGKIISQVDLILSSLYSHLIEDWNMIFIKNRDFYISNIGMKIFMFYFPCAQPINTDYSDYLKNKSVGYLITNIVDKNNKKISYLNFNKSNNEAFENINAKFSYHYPLSIDIDKVEKTVNEEQAYFDKSWLNDDEFLNNSKEKSEGVILKYKSDIYQCLFQEHKVENEPIVEKPRTPFEYLLADITAFYKSAKPYFQNYITNSYVSSVCNIFNAYISYWVPNSNIEKEITAEDIEAPSIHKYDINYSYIPSVQTKTLCMSNKIYENIFKVMLANMCKKKKLNYCVYLNKSQVDDWNNIVDLISYYVTSDF